MRLGFKVQTLTTDDHRLAKMAKQVKDVLPHVPLNVIAKDLGRSHSCWAVNHKYGLGFHLIIVASRLCAAKTNCIDTTITNLLESKEDMQLDAAEISTFGPSTGSSYSSASAPTLKVF